MRFLNLIEEGDCYFWDGTFTCDVQKVHGDKCVMIKPSVSANPRAGMSNFYYDRQCLLDIGVQFTLENQAGTGCSKQKTSEVQKNKCRICHKNIACNKKRGHVGYHILMKDIATNVCGFCGLQSCSNKLKQSSKSSTTKYFKLESSCAYFLHMDENLCTPHVKNVQIIWPDVMFPNAVLGSTTWLIITRNATIQLTFQNILLFQKTKKSPFQPLKTALNSFGYLSLYSLTNVDKLLYCFFLLNN